MDLVKVKKGKIVVADELIKELEDFYKLSIQMEIKQKEFKEELLKAMETNGITESFNLGEIKVVYKKSYFKNSVDTEKLKKDGLYDKYKKQSPVKSSISLSIE
jgi:hypothetical protein